jgi:hypothetical protein
VRLWLAGWQAACGNLAMLRAVLTTATVGVPHPVCCHMLCRQAWLQTGCSQCWTAMGTCS